jgi:beta-glucosidase
MDPARYLEAHLGAVATAVASGVPVGAYFHWTLADNYEWGSYEPRFGLYGMERLHGEARWTDLDAMGDDSAGTYRRLIEEWRQRAG